MIARPRTETPFTRKVLALLRRVPVGRVISYGALARLAGKPRAARAVGNIMRDAQQPGLPYHRVIAAGGRLGGYGGYLGLKRALLVAEGLVVTGSRVRNLAAVSWPDPPARRGSGRSGKSAAKRRKAN